MGEVTGKWSSLPIGMSKNRVPDSRSQILIPGDDICQIEFHAQKSVSAVNMVPFSSQK